MPCTCTHKNGTVVGERRCYDHRVICPPRSSPSTCRHHHHSTSPSKDWWSEADVLRSKSLVKPNNFLSVLGVGSAISEQPKGREIEISETKGSSTMHLCNISLPLSVAAGSHKHHKWMGPAIRMSLPSFSGQTEDHPDLLKNSCQMECRVRPVKPAGIWSP